MLLLPHHHEFAETLANLPFFYREMANQTCEVMHVIQSSPNHVPEMVNTNKLTEYLLGGEVDQYIDFVDGYSSELLEEEESDGLDSWKLSDEWLGSI